MSLFFHEFQQNSQFLEVVLLLQILTAFNKLKIMSEVVLLLRNTDSFQQVEDYVRVYLQLVGGCQCFVKVE
jgi:hypothetical protein